MRSDGFEGQACPSGIPQTFAILATSCSLVILHLSQDTTSHYSSLSPSNLAVCSLQALRFPFPFLPPGAPLAGLVRLKRHIISIPRPNPHSDKIAHHLALLRLSLPLSLELMLTPLNAFTPHGRVCLSLADGFLIGDQMRQSRRDDRRLLGRSRRPAPLLRQTGGRGRECSS